MNAELAQIVALVAYGNKYLSSHQGDIVELLPSHSTFDSVSDVKFQKKRPLADDTLGGEEVLGKGTHSWFSYLQNGGVKYLKLDLLNLPGLPLPFATSIFTAGSNWVIQTDKAKCWRADWSLANPRHFLGRIWNVEYRESDNLPVIIDFPDIETAYSNLDNSLVKAHEFSGSCNLGWDNWFGEAIELLHNPFPIQPYYADLIPNVFASIRVRQLLAGALKAWVFGGLGSWNDMYIIDSSQEKEYQRISKSLYRAIIQAIGAVTNSTVGHRFVKQATS